MSKEKALEFLKFMETNKEIQEKMSGFTPEELDEAANEISGELSDSELSSAAGGINRVVPSWVRKMQAEQMRNKERESGTRS
ncbi:MAG: hypothetical protein A2017_02525 [Lentisphaerae bacterium GWF2_44_16]|nr:MAG: hypothetical protein A2017_02525 [Lentisphaerae bacterium GWF2_44_16]